MCCDRGCWRQDARPGDRLAFLPTQGSSFQESWALPAFLAVLSLCVTLEMGTGLANIQGLSIHNVLSSPECDKWEQTGLDPGKGE